MCFSNFITGVTCLSFAAWKTSCLTGNWNHQSGTTDEKLPCFVTGKATPILHINSVIGGTEKLSETSLAE